MAEDDRGGEEPKSLGLVWVRPKVDGLGPSARGGHSMVAAGQYLIVFGGQYYGGGDKFVYCNDVHVLDLETMKWHEPQCSGDLPEPRYGHSSHLVGSRMFVLGGRGEGGSLPKDVYYLDTATWAWHRVQLTTTAPPGRLCHAAALVGTKVVVFGGWDARRSMDDLWVFDTDTMGWIRPRTTGPAPPARHGATLDLLPDGRLVLCAGAAVVPGSAPAYSADVRVLDTATMAWSRGSVTGEYPVARHWATSVVLGGTLLFFGGWSGTERAVLQRLPAHVVKAEGGAGDGSRVGYLVALDGAEMRWEHPPCSGRFPASRYGHATCRVRNHVYSWGGWDGNRALRELVELVVVDEEYEAEVRQAVEG